MLTRERKDEIQQLALATINSMGSRFSERCLILKTPEEAIYAARLWKSRCDGLQVTYYANNS